MNDSPQKSSDNSNDFTVGFLAGAVFGGIMTYLWFVPEGKEKVKELFEHGIDVAENLEKQVVQTGKEVMEEAQKIEKKEQVSAQEAVVKSTKKRFFKKNS